MGGNRFLEKLIKGWGGGHLGVSYRETAREGGINSELTVEKLTGGGYLGVNYRESN